MRLGIADHLGWAVAVTADDQHRVVDRRRIELIEPDVPNMPIHHDSKRLDLEATAALLVEVRASVRRATAAAFDALSKDITSISLRVIPSDFPTDLAEQCRVPYEARADAVMYREVLVEAAEARGWAVCFYDAKDVEARAAELLAARAGQILEGPRAELGPPWAKDHRTALAATVLVSHT